MTKVETITNHIGRNQDCTSSNCIPVCAIKLAVLTPLYPECDRHFMLFGCMIGTPIGALIVIGVALLGWSSFEFDTIQGNG